MSVSMWHSGRLESSGDSSCVIPAHIIDLFLLVPPLLGGSPGEASLKYGPLERFRVLNHVRLCPMSWLCLVILPMSVFAHMFCDTNTPMPCSIGCMPVLFDFITHKGLGPYIYVAGALASLRSFRPSRLGEFLCCPTGRPDPCSCPLSLFSPAVIILCSLYVPAQG